MRAVLLVRRVVEVTEPEHPGEFAAPAKIGRFVIEGVLGRGGMGIVLAARDPELERAVAIKVLHEERLGDDDHQLEREGRALARLAHPNVCAIFEIGRVEGRRFIAMERIDGGTLAAWLAERPRRWHDIVAMFVACGRGLEAAHAAEIVHRDFKPDNVLVGVDGRPRVVDFGLVDMVEPGAVIGTPAYMAPEQLDGEAADARADQFGYCVALHTALYRTPPFAGYTVDELRVSVRGPRHTPPRGRVPSWIDAVIARGLAADPAARWPSMTALLRALARDPGARRRRVAVGVGFLGLAGIASWALLRAGAPAPSDPCAGAAERVYTVWTPALRATIAHAFLAIDAGYAPGVAHYVDDRLGAAATAIAAARVEACVATHRRGEQSSIVLDARMSCLDRRLDALAETADLLAHADRGMLDRAPAAVKKLPDVAECADVVALSALPAEPTDPAARSALAEVRRRIEAVVAADKLGDPASALAEATAVVAAAKTLGYCPVEANALRARAELLVSAASDQAGLDAARAELQRAAHTADSCAADQVRSAALLSVLTVTTQVATDRAEVAAAFEAATAAAGRLKAPGHRRAIAILRATQAADDGRLDEAITLGEAVLADLRTSDDPHNPSFTERLAKIHLMHGDLARAEELANESYRELLARYGQAHPEPAKLAQLLANIKQERGDLAGSIALLEQVLQVQRSAYGPEHRTVLITRVNLAGERAFSGDGLHARPELEELLPIVRRMFGPEHELIATVLDHLVVASDKDPPAAIAYGREAVALAIKRTGEDSLDAASRRGNLATALVNAGHAGEGAAMARAALATELTKMAPTSVGVARTRLTLGHALAADGKIDEARVELALARKSFLLDGGPAAVAAVDREIAAIANR